MEKLFHSGEEGSVMRAVSLPDVLEAAAILWLQNPRCTQDSTAEVPANIEMEDESILCSPCWDDHAFSSPRDITPHTWIIFTKGTISSLRCSLAAGRRGKSLHENT